ncbi:MAG: SDR family NAD(P)-dependent oxidoreductase, partial [Gemmatimonadetes bacterium]|nr:SDR family NAD(P)-dependent oxidoreductase [Gemmatimonadota bacterium]NIY35270.1 SDR family NAD(P)-dependent oxidoreductase [Gemmatimonadota bacterium]
GDAVATALKQAATERSWIDVVVSTPGVNVRKPLVDYEDDDFERVIRVNLKGALNVLRSAGKIMADQGSGSIILFSSI